MDSTDAARKESLKTQILRIFKVMSEMCPGPVKSP